MTDIVIIEGDLDNSDYLVKNTELNLKEPVKENTDVSYEIILKCFSESLMEIKTPYNWLPKALGGSLEEVLDVTLEKVNDPEIDTEDLFEAIVSLIPYDSHGNDIHTITNIKTIPCGSIKEYF